MKANEFFPLVPGESILLMEKRVVEPGILRAIARYVDAALAVGINPLPGLRLVFPLEHGFTLMTKAQWYHLASATEILILIEILDGRCQAIEIWGDARGSVAAEGAVQLAHYNLSIQELENLA